eukprot:911078-Ditylum_brightwellii.AAC.1
MKKKSQYTAIIGRDVLQQNKINILNSKLTFAWDRIKNPMDKSVKLQVEEKFLVEAKYEKIVIDDVVNNQQHLTEDEHTLLQTLLKESEDLFQGKIRVWLGETIELKLKDPDMEPFQVKPYHVPHS